MEPRLNLGHCGKFEVSIDDVLIHIVSHDPDLRMLQQDIGQPAQIAGGIAHASRV